MLRWCLSTLDRRGNRSTWSNIRRRRHEAERHRSDPLAPDATPRYLNFPLAHGIGTCTPQKLERKSVGTGSRRSSYLPNNDRHSLPKSHPGSGRQMQYTHVRSAEVLTGMLQYPAILSTASETQLAPAAPGQELRPEQDSHLVLNALIILRNFLSLENMSSSNPQTHTPDELKSLYASIKSRSQLHQLGSRRMSVLLGLLGSLSLPHSRRMTMYTNKFVSNIKIEGKGQSHWPFVLGVAQDKERLRMGFTNADHYWIMTAHIANANGRMSQQQLDTIFQTLRYSTGPEVHVPYLQALLSFRTLECLSEAVRKLSNLLTQHPTFHPRLVTVLWTVILKPGVEMPGPMKSLLLSALSSRLTKFEDMIIGDTRDLPTQVSRPNGVEAGLQDDFSLGVAELCKNLTAVIFHPSMISCQPPLVQWSLCHALAAFASDIPVETRWSNLVLLALFNSPSELSKGHSGKLALSLSRNEVNRTGDWLIIHVLATLEVATGTTGSLDIPKEMSEGTRDITRTLWHAWSGMTPETYKSPIFVVRAIIASFFRLAAVSQDASLKDACYRYSVSNFLWVATEGDELARVQKRLLIEEYVVACIACGETNWERIFSMLADVFSGTGWQSEIASTLIIHFGRRDPNIAYQLFLFCSQNSIHVSTNSIHSVGMSLLSSKRVDFVIPFLHDRRFSRQQTKELLDAALLLLTGCQNRYMGPTLIGSVCDAMHDLYATSRPSSAFCWRIERVLLLAATLGHPSKVIAIIQAIQHNPQPYFTPKFFFRLLRELAARRQFRHAMSLLDLVAKTHTSHIRAFRRTLTFRLTKGGASALARRANRHQIRCSTKESLARRLDFRLKSPSRVLALKILPTLQHAPSDLPSIQYALHMLIHASRILAAKKLFERTQGELDTKARTSLGNIMLHGALLRPSRRNGRRIRKVLSVLDLLVKKYSFVPDRITVNILLKSILRWTQAIDSEKLKVLFDHMIRSGYPAGDLPGVPFGTPLSSPVDVQLPNLPPFISFEKHIRPMYKMFIKAFHVRGDVRSARTVIGILKAEESASFERTEIRSRARQAGRIRARKLINGRK